MIAVKLNVDKQDASKIATKYGVSAIPALFVMNADGKVLGTIDFIPEPAKFNARLQAILAKNGAGPAHGPPRKHGK